MPLFPKNFGKRTIPFKPSHPKIETPKKGGGFMLSSFYSSPNEPEGVLEKCIVLNFTDAEIVELPDFVKVIKIKIPGPEDLPDLPEIRRPILGVLESLDKGRENVFFGNFVLVLPDDPLLAYCLGEVFKGLNKKPPLVASIEKINKDQIRIKGIIDSIVFAREGDRIFQEVQDEFLPKAKTLARLLRIY